MQSLLQQEGRSVLRDPQTLKLLIAPILAHNREEQQKFYRVFEDYLEESQTMAALRLKQRKEEAEEIEEQIQIVKRNTLPRWAVAAALLLMLGIAMLGIFREGKPRLKSYFSIMSPDSSLIPLDTELGDKVTANTKMQDSLHFQYQAGDTPDGLQVNKLSWTIGDSLIHWTDSDSFANHVTWMCKKEGVLRVRLSVEYANEDGIDSLETDHFHAEIQVGCRNLMLPGFSWNPQNPKVGKEVTFTVDSTIADKFTYEWEFENTAIQDTSSTVNYTFAENGDFLVKLTSTLRQASAYNCENQGETQRTISVRSNQPKTELVSDGFSLERDNEGTILSRLSKWSLILISLGITLLLLMLALLGRLWFHKRRLRSQDEKFAIEEESPFTIPFPSQDHLIAPDTGIYDLASLMRQRRIGNIQQINLPRSIRKTIEESGLPIIHFDTYSRPSEYLILIDQRHPDSHLARFFGRISEILEGEDVLLDTFFYDKDPRFCWSADHPEGLSLEQLRQRYRKHRLILFSTGHHLLDPYDALLLPWFAPAFEIWKENRLILTPIPVADWGYRERELMREIDVLPLDIPGQMYMIEMFDEIGQPDFQEHKTRLLETFPTAGDGFTDHDLYSLEGLDAYLGPDLFRWLAATAVYPLPNWEITLAIGHALTGKGEAYLLTFDHLLRLARIPWLQDNDLPLRLRMQLLDSLDPNTEREARQAVLDLLGQVEVRPGSFIAHKIAIQEVTHQFFLTPGDKEIAEQMYYLMQQDKLADPAVRKRLAQNLDLLEGENAKNYLEQRFGALRPREMLIAGGLGLLLSWLLYMWMGTIVSPHSQSLVESQEATSSFWMDRSKNIDPAVEWNNQAVEQADSMFQLETAKSLLGRALNSRPNYPIAESNLSKVHYRLGVEAFNQQNQQQYLEAITHFSRVKQEANQNTFLWSLGGISLSYYYLEDLDYAVQYAEQLKALDLAFAQRNFANLLVALQQTQASYESYIAQAEAFFQQKAYQETVIAADSALVYRAEDSLALALRTMADSLYQVELTFEPFAGHTRSIWSVAIAPDGQQVLTGSFDQTAKLWDLTGNEIQTFAGHSGLLRSVAFSPDGQQILTGSDDNTAKLWDLSGQEIQTFAGHRGKVVSVAFSPDGQYILTGSVDRTAKLWNRAGKEIQTFVGHGDEVPSVAFSPDGQHILTGSTDNTAKLWDLSGQEIQTFAGHRGSIYSVAFSPDGQQILTGSYDRTAKLWNRAGEEIRSFAGHTSHVRSVAFSPDGQYILTGSRDQTAKLWDLAGQEIQSFAGHSSSVESVAFVPDGKQIALAVGNSVVLHQIDLPEVAEQPPLPTMIRIPGGTFLMGSEVGLANEQPVHSVSLSDFFMARTEVTNAQYAAFLTAKGDNIDSVGRWIELSDSRIQQEGPTFSVEAGFERHPAAYVSWYGATAYCRWVSEISGQTWRLPTEAEWEYAAGGGSLGRDSAGQRLHIYSGSNSADLVAWYDDNSQNRTQPVASKAPNELGLYDMSGNLYEWCQDWYDSYTNSPQQNPMGSNSGSRRVYRGGSWSSVASYLRVADRHYWYPDLRRHNLGFRPARTP